MFHTLCDLDSVHAIIVFFKERTWSCKKLSVQFFFGIPILWIDQNGLGKDKTAKLSKCCINVPKKVSTNGRSRTAGHTEFDPSRLVESHAEFHWW